MWLIPKITYMFFVQSSQTIWRFCAVCERTGQFQCKHWAKSDPIRHRIAGETYCFKQYRLPWFSFWDVEIRWHGVLWPAVLNNDRFLQWRKPRTRRLGSRRGQGFVALCCRDICIGKCRFSYFGSVGYCRFGQVGIPECRIKYHCMIHSNAVKFCSIRINIVYYGAGKIRVCKVSIG